ncbi:MAG: ABC transporter permease [Lachnospiraceae bacterium]|nr:ABC transporter permease [Lachnospiraceae bacterium]
MAMNEQEIKKMMVDHGRKEARQTVRLRLLTVATLILFLVVWQAVVDNGLVNSRTLPSPTTILKAFMSKFSSKVPDGNTILTNILASLQVSLFGFFAAVILGVPLGLLMGWYKGMDRFCTVIFELVRPVPSIAWIPIVVMWMGIGLEAKVLIIFLSAFVPCVINSYTGVKLTNPVLVNVSKTLGAKNTEIFFRISIPSAVPMVMAGIRLALGNSWSTLVAAEMLAASAGLGFMIQMGRQFSRADIVVMGMLLIGILGACMSFLFTLIENHLLRWKVTR